MKIITWNCRGLRNPSTILNLRNLIRSSQVDVLFLSETHYMTDFGIHLHLLGFDHYFQVNAASNWSGGLLLLWHSNINLTIQQSSQFMIHASVQELDKAWDMVCFYGQPERSLRRDF